MKKNKSDYKNNNYLEVTLLECNREFQIIKFGWVEIACITQFLSKYQQNLCRIQIIISSAWDMFLI